MGLIGLLQILIMTYIEQREFL